MHIFRPRSPRIFLVVSLFCVLLSFPGCASRFEKALEQVYTLDEALLNFGAPSSREALPDGRERLEWTLDREITVPGQYVTRGYYLGHDRDGFPVYVYRNVWAPEHLRYINCTLVIVVDDSGRALERRWNGNSCERLLFHSLPPERNVSD